MRKILRNLRTWLIHKLGGVTEEERIVVFYKSFQKGKIASDTDIITHSKSLYGIKAEEWCKKMYEYIEAHHCKDVYDLHKLDEIDISKS